eukprot:s7121_g2.t1
MPEAQSPTASIAAGSGAEAAEVEDAFILRLYIRSPPAKSAEPQSSERARLHGGFVVCKGQSTEPPNQPPQFHMYSRSEGARGPGSGADIAKETFTAAPILVALYNCCRRWWMQSRAPECFHVVPRDSELHALVEVLEIEAASQDFGATLHAATPCEAYRVGLYDILEVKVRLKLQGARSIQTMKLKKSRTEVSLNPLKKEEEGLAAAPLYLKFQTVSDQFVCEVS